MKKTVFSSLITLNEKVHSDKIDFITNGLVPFMRLYSQLQSHIRDLKLLFQVASFSSFFFTRLIY